ncbi:KPN_02809 family neutral zinc metallopeptidase [Acuticoccus yangtzensis]|uniref:KPN_02809 family neutral zinc metallopeptidase n=1 Tax=Acuticoccus yangtzensis TaxID=1443441 RepID=UPI0009499E3F|nr:neutral zinc metallopeptidase [Acuticoccus yangtzensis]ORE92158.1 zinc metallopeptidase [Stappia sp. 22II-S9-Z10]
MRWENRRQSDNFEDRRGSGGIFRPAGLPRGGRIRIPRGGSSGGMKRAGGGSIILFVVVAALLWAVAGINPLQLIEILAGGGGGGTVTTQQQAPRTPEQQAADDETVGFVRVVLAETEDTWGRIFQNASATYDPPTLVTYSGATPTGCGFGSAAAGPFYCPNDRKIYVDLSFFDMLAQRFQAPGDFAQAYVLAHEVGHHVQNETGTLGRYHQARQRLSEGEANALSVRVELQADCYAGIWAHSAGNLGLLEEGDIQEAMDAASAVGDDTMQRRSQGYVVPESFNHGTSEQRMRWFQSGYRSGDPADCDTLEGTGL